MAIAIHIEVMVHRLHIIFYTLPDFRNRFGAPFRYSYRSRGLNNYGGWILDSQFEHEMGSPYLLAHGVGVPVADATTKGTTELAIHDLTGFDGRCDAIFPT